MTQLWLMLLRATIIYTAHVASPFAKWRNFLVTSIRRRGKDDLASNPRRQISGMDVAALVVIG